MIPTTGRCPLPCILAPLNLFTGNSLSSGNVLAKGAQDKSRAQSGFATAQCCLSGQSHADMSFLPPWEGRMKPLMTTKELSQ